MPPRHLFLSLPCCLWPVRLSDFLPFSCPLPYFLFYSVTLCTCFSLLPVCLLLRHSNSFQHPVCTASCIFCPLCFTHFLSLSLFLLFSVSLSLLLSDVFMPACFCLSASAIVRLSLLLSCLHSTPLPPTLPFSLTLCMALAQCISMYLSSPLAILFCCLCLSYLMSLFCSLTYSLN